MKESIKLIEEQINLKTVQQYWKYHLVVENVWKKVITYAKFRYHSLTDPRPKFGTYGPYSQYKLRFIHTLDLRREIDRGHDKYILFLFHIYIFPEDVIRLLGSSIVSIVILKGKTVCRFAFYCSLIPRNKCGPFAIFFKNKSHSVCVHSYIIFSLKVHKQKNMK